MRQDEGLSNEALIAEKYRGIRPAPGYPACPEHTEKGPLFELLQAPKNAGITITESFAMLPTAAVSGFYFSHPQAQYFATGKVDKDQVADYAQAQGLDAGRGGAVVGAGVELLIYGHFLTSTIDAAYFGGIFCGVFCLLHFL